MSNLRIDELLVLGAGYVGNRVRDEALRRGLPARTVGRHDGDVVRAEFDASLAELVSPHTHVVVTFPPDGATDARIALQPGAITYVSSTGVYAGHRGLLDDSTAPTGPSLRLEAEAIWRDRGATILRCPAIYGPDRGLHLRIQRGIHRIPGDGSGFVSRIHVDDLVALLLAAPNAPGETFVVGDAEPLTHLDAARRVAEHYEIPLPPFTPLAEVPVTLRGDRRVDGSRALQVLGVTLRHPTYEP